MVARFIGGLGVGASSIAAPVYIAEISPPESRGKLGGLFQFNIVLGMVVSQLVNWALGDIRVLRRVPCGASLLGYLRVPRDEGKGFGGNQPITVP